MPLLPLAVEQQPIEELSEFNWDVIVAGAGPAGSIAAGYLAGKGHRTLLLDKEAFPREKVCGDALTRDSLGFLTKIGLCNTVESVGHRVQMAGAYGNNDVRVEIPGPYLTLRRRYLDSILAKRAVEAGVTFCRGKVVHFAGENENVHAVHIAGLAKPVHARYFILSTGAQIGIARSLLLLGRTFPSAFAARCYVQSKEKLDLLVGWIARPVIPGYGWIFPMGDHLYNTGVIAFCENRRESGLNLKRRFNEFISEFPLAHKVIRSGKIISDLAAAPLLCGLPRSVVPGRGNLIATGETIGSTFNFTGEGIGKAMETGELAAKIVHDALFNGRSDIVSRFIEELDLKLRHKYNGYAIAERCMAQPLLHDFIARRMMESNYLRQAAIDMIVQKAYLQKVFSLRGVMKCLWS